MFLWIHILFKETKYQWLKHRPTYSCVLLSVQFWHILLNQAKAEDREFFVSPCHDMNYINRWLLCCCQSVNLPTGEPHSGIWDKRRPQTSKGRYSVGCECSCWTLLALRSSWPCLIPAGCSISTDDVAHPASLIYFQFCLPQSFIYFYSKYIKLVIDA